MTEIIIWSVCRAVQLVIVGPVARVFVGRPLIALSVFSQAGRDGEFQELCGDRLAERAPIQGIVQKRIGSGADFIAEVHGYAFSHLRMMRACLKRA